MGAEIYSRGYKKTAIAEMMFETLAIFLTFERLFFLFFLFFMHQSIANLHMGRFFCIQYTVAAKEGYKVEPFLMCKTFVQDAWPKYH